MKYLLLLGAMVGPLFGDVLSMDGKIRFDAQTDGAPEMILNITGLGIGISPSTNLHVKGSALVSDQLFVGGNSGSSKLNINGTIGYNVQVVSSNTTLGSNSLVLVDSSSANLTMTLPYAGNVTGRLYQIKKVSAFNSVWVTGGGNLIDDTNVIELPDSLSLASVKLISDGSQWYKIDQKDINETVAADNLAGWWKLDESSGNTANDSSLYNSSGTLSSGFSFSTDGIAGKVSKALTFNGSSDKIMIPDQSSLDLSVYTITAWIKIPDSTSNQTIYAKTNNATSGLWFFKRRSGLDNKLTIMTFNGGANPQFQGDIVPIDEWHFVCVVVSNNNATLYQNGVQTNSGTIVQYTDNVFDVAIGSTSTGSQFLKGGLDDIRVYNKALTVSEIQAIYKL